MARTLDDALGDWLQFAAIPRTVRETSDWCTVKAMEIEWDFYDLTDVLFEIRRPMFSDPEDHAEPRPN